MALGDSAWSALNGQLGSYFAGLPAGTDQTVTTPDGKVLKRYTTNVAPTRAAPGAGGSDLAGMDALLGLGYDANKAAYDYAQTLPEDQRYGYTEYGSTDLSHGHVQDYGTNTDGTVNTQGTDYNNNDSLFNGTIFPGIVKAAIGAAAGMAGGEIFSGLGSGATGATGGAADIGSASYNPFNPANWTADAGTTATDATAAASTAANTAAQGANWYDPLTSAWNAASSGYGNLNPLLKLGLGTVASSGLKAATGSGGDGSDDASSTNPFASIVQAYQNGGGPSGTGQSFSDSNYSSQPGNLDYNPASSADWTDAIKSGYNTVKDITGLNGSQLLNGVGSITSALLGSNAAKTAAGQQTSAINNANALTAAIYGDSVNRNASFLNAGTSALGQQTSLLGLNGADAQQTARTNFTTSPGYQFRFDQGVKAVGSGAAASGMLGSGRYMKDLTNYGQGQATSEYGNYTNNLTNLINLGQNSANLTGQLGANYGNTAAALTTAGGIAQSAGTMGSTNAITNALSQFLKNQSQNGIYGGG